MFRHFIACVYQAVDCLNVCSTQELFKCSIGFDQLLSFCLKKCIKDMREKIL